MMNDQLDLKKHICTAWALVVCLIFSAYVVNADSSSSYVFEDGGIDLGGGKMQAESDTYILDHTVTYDIAENLSQSENYEEITWHTALQVFCGNEIVEPGEECDDGNQTNGDTCSSVCKIEPPICGNGYLETWEECDDGNTNNGDTCTSECKNGTGLPGGGGTIYAICGDGKVEQSEECDDGNKVSGDGCSKSCRVESSGGGGGTHSSGGSEPKTECGNGELESGEECDDGNWQNEDGCSSLCEIEESVESWEWGVESEEKQEEDNAEWTTETEEKEEEGETEDEEKADPKPEELVKPIEPVEPEEREVPVVPVESVEPQEPDTPEGVEPVIVCGNGNLEDEEECDDANTVDGDGCSAMCMVEIIDVDPVDEDLVEPEDNVDDPISGLDTGDVPPIVSESAIWPPEGEQYSD